MIERTRLKPFTAIEPVSWLKAKSTAILCGFLPEDLKVAVGSPSEAAKAARYLVAVFARAPTAMDEVTIQRWREMLARMGP